MDLEREKQEGIARTRADSFKDNGAASVIVVQGEGTVNKLLLNCPKLLRFNELSEDEFFITEPAAKAGVTYKNTSGTEPLALLSYFGPKVNPDAPRRGIEKVSGFQFESKTPW